MSRAAVVWRFRVKPLKFPHEEPVQNTRKAVRHLSETGHPFVVFDWPALFPIPSGLPASTTLTSTSVWRPVF